MKPIRDNGWYVLDGDTWAVGGNGNASSGLKNPLRLSVLGLFEQPAWGGKMAVNACPIWNTPAEEFEPFDYGGRRLDSPRAGGRYEITSFALNMLGTLSPEDRAKLTTWIVDQHRAGVEAPRVTDDVIKEVRGKRPLKTSERISRLFLLLSRRRIRPADTIMLGGSPDTNPDATVAEFAAWLESVDGRDTVMLVRLLIEEGLVHQVGSGQAYALTGKGFERLEQTEISGAGSNQAFVAMWFDPSVQDAYAAAIDPAIRDAGYSPFRIDKKEHANKIDDEIVAEIKRSRFVVADFTCPVFEAAGKKRPDGRGGVYYEAGFAQGLGIPVIWTCRADCLDHVHFDTRQYSHVVWANIAELRDGLYNRIAALIGTTPDAQGKGSSTPQPLPT